MKLILRLFLAISLFSSASFAEDGRFAARSLDGQGAVASVNPLATRAGIAAIEAGGNAIDAAVAAALTLGVVDSHNSGIGGGAFVLVRYANGDIQAIDGREMAPAAAHRDMYIIDGKLDKTASKTGALASGIPGSVAAFDYLIRKAGNRSWGEAFEHGIHYADAGFAVDPVMAKRFSRVAKELPQFEASKAIFLKADGSLYQAGDWLVQKDLARSYRKLAKHGSRWFYRGEFARKTARWMRENGGIITRKDFANYQLLEREPIRGEYRGLDIVSFPPPSSGGIHIVQMLNMLEPYPLAAMATEERLHLLAEVMRRAFADRAHWLGDSDFVPVPAGLTDKAYAKTQMQSFAPSRSDDVSAGQPGGDAIDTGKILDGVFDKHTTHVTAADKDGNWVAITTTLNTSFGSKVVIPGTGVLMNNQMDDFSLQPGVTNAFGLVGNEANAVAAHKRPLSSMSPTLVLHNGKPVITAGAAGGPTIITQVLQNLVNVIDLGLDPAEALAAQRVHHQWRPNMLMVEKSLAPEIQAALKAKGHRLYPRSYLGASQMIAWDPDAKEFMPAAEPRIIGQH